MERFVIRQADLRPPDQYVDSLILQGGDVGLQIEGDGWPCGESREYVFPDIVTPAGHDLRDAVYVFRRADVALLASETRDPDSGEVFPAIWSDPTETDAVLIDVRPLAGA